MQCIRRSYFATKVYSDHNIAVGRYVIMPDHVHLFIRGPDNFKLGQWIGMLKQNLAKQIEDSGTTSMIWQRGFFDHLLRSDESYAQKWNYVRENPVRAGLLTNADDWPYSGDRAHRSRITVAVALRATFPRVSLYESGWFK
jgi:putative transposase